jgi:hypothetical protein
MVVVIICCLLIISLIGFYVPLVIKHMGSLSRDAGLLFVVPAVMIIFAVVLRKLGVMKVIHAVLPGSICLILAIASVASICFRLLKPDVDIGDFAQYLFNRLFVFVMFSMFCDFALYIVEPNIPCALRENNVKFITDICDDLNGPQGTCMSSHWETHTADEVCTQRSIGFITWPAANPD